MKHCPACHLCYDDARADCAEDHSALVESRPGSPLLAGKYRLEEFPGRGVTARVRPGYAVEDKRWRKRNGEITQELRLVKAGGGWKNCGPGGESVLR